MAVEDAAFRRSRLSETKRALFSKLLQAGAGSAEELTIPRQPRGEIAPMSFAEQRLWFLDTLDSSAAVYVIPAALRLSGKLGSLILAQAVNELVSRHEALRTTFGSREGEPVQIISTSGSCDVPIVDLTDLRPREREYLAERLSTEAATRTFDLAAGPLLRVSLASLSQDEHLLILAMHHIISDGWSVGVFVKEIGCIYNAFSVGEPSGLPELPIQYADFSIWQRERLQGPVFDQQLGFWKKLLEGAPELIDIATDRLRPPVQSFQGSYLQLDLLEGTGQALKRLCQDCGASLFMGLLAAFQTLLFRYTGNPDLVVGSPIANRNYKELEPLIGFFVNSLAFRADFSDDPSFGAFLNRVKETTLDAYAHQELPFERIVEELSPNRNVGYNPLFQVLIAVQNAPVAALDLGGARVSDQQLSFPFTHFDLELHFWDDPDGIHGSILYSTDLFDHTTIQRMALHLQNIIGQGAANPLANVSALPFLTPSESHHIVSEWNASSVDYSLDKCV
ncbi:MAG TPA: condensation domain-containing protein, partial [Blastocatellia bacterium]